jgi:hypothetical protein
MRLLFLLPLTKVSRHVPILWLRTPLARACLASLAPTVCEAIACQQLALRLAWLRSKVAAGALHGCTVKLQPAPCMVAKSSSSRKSLPAQLNIPGLALQLHGACLRSEWLMLVTELMSGHDLYKSVKLPLFRWHRRYAPTLLLPLTHA